MTRTDLDAVARIDTKIGTQHPRVTERMGVMFGATVALPATLIGLAEACRCIAGPRLILPVRVVVKPGVRRSRAGVVQW